jgi:putative chitinase
MSILNNLNEVSLALCTGSTPEKAKEFLPFIKEVCKGFEITTKERLAAFLAQIGHESAGLSQLEENLNYSKYSLANTWPTRYAAKGIDGKYLVDKSSKYLPNTTAELLHRQPAKIANNCYANRMGNSDESSGDGWKYRGRGLKQLTGKSNYAALTLDTGIDFVSNPELLLQPLYATISAAWFWKVNNLEVFADKGDIEGMTKKINGGLLGIVNRKALYKKSMIVLK